jgi:GNAT superfamily N-acetyltransferase
MTSAVARLATDADLEPAAHALALAHHDYQWAAWAFPRSDRQSLLRQLFRLDLQVGIAREAAWVVDHAASVAIWSPPAGSAVDQSLLDRVRHEQDAVIGDDAARLQAADRLTRAHHPDRPYWYLGTVGTVPDRRGEGLATAVVTPILDRCDDEHFVACLETSSDDNVRLYERLGFVTVFQTTVDDGALPLIVMHRQPR